MGTSSLTVGMWHVWQLCVVLVVAVQPLLIGHLFRQLADRPGPAASSACVKSVWQVAHSSESRMCVPSVGLNVADEIITRGLAVLDLERTVDRPLAGWPRRVDLEAADEALALAEVVRRDLMADRAGHAVGGQAIAGLRLDERQVREHFALVARELRFVPRGRHVADRALVLDGRLGGRVIDDFPPDARLPVRIAGGVRHHARAPVVADRDVFAGRAWSGRCGRRCSARRSESACRRRYGDSWSSASLAAV